MHVDPRFLPMDILVDEYVHGIDEDLALYLRSEGVSPWMLRHRRSSDRVTAVQAILGRCRRVAAALHALKHNIARARQG